MIHLGSIMKMVYILINYNIYLIRMTFLESFGELIIN